MEGQEALLSRFVMEAIADDYENLEHIMRWVSKSTRAYGIQISYERLIDTLRQLVSDGYAQAYRLSAEPPYSTPVSCSGEDLSDFWFYLTPTGLNVVRKRISISEGSNN